MSVSSSGEGKFGGLRAGQIDFHTTARVAFSCSRLSGDDAEQAFAKTILGLGQGSFLVLNAEAMYGVQGGAQNLERIPPPKGAPPGLPKFRASGQTIDKDDKVRVTPTSRTPCGHVV